MTPGETCWDRLARPTGSARGAPASRGPAGAARKPASSRATTPASAKSGGTTYTSDDSSQDTNYSSSNSPSDASSSRSTEVSAEAATDSDDDDCPVAEIVSEDEDATPAMPAKLEALKPHELAAKRVATRQAAEKEKKEREAAEKAKRRRPVSGPGSTNTSFSSPPPIPRKSPPPSLAKVFEEGGVEWNAVEGKKFATMGAAQLRETFAHRDLKKHRENASKFSADLMKKRETATRLRPKVAYGDITPINAQAEKEKFLAAWIAYDEGRRKRAKNNPPPADPTFQYADPESALKAMDDYGVPRDDLIGHAQRIMDEKRARHGDGAKQDERFEQAVWGEPMAGGARDMGKCVNEYLDSHGIGDKVTIRWHENLAVASMTMARGRKSCEGTLNLPKQPGKKYSRALWVQGLLDHEIGTHFTCSINDLATAPYLRGSFAAGAAGGSRSFNNFPRSRKVTPREHLVTEEGLATLNTHMSAKVKLLNGPALSYWTRWQGSQMGFTQLFEALEPYVSDLQKRWQQCYRCKRGLTDTSEHKSYAKDQCYFEGAYKLLEGRRHIDFRLLHSGKIALEEYADARAAWLRLVNSRAMQNVALVTPHFLKKEGEYEDYLETIAAANGIEANPKPKIEGYKNQRDVTLVPYSDRSKKRSVVTSPVA